MLIIQLFEGVKLNLNLPQWMYDWYPSMNVVWLTMYDCYISVKTIRLVLSIKMKWNTYFIHCGGPWTAPLGIQIYNITPSWSHSRATAPLIDRGLRILLTDRLQLVTNQFCRGGGREVKVGWPSGQMACQGSNTSTTPRVSWESLRRPTFNRISNGKYRKIIGLFHNRAKIEALKW